MCVFPIIYFITPFTALIADDTLRYTVFLLVLVVKGFVVIVGFPCTTILLTNSASSLRILGTLNGFATTFSGLGRAVGPAATGAVFSWGVQHGYVIAPWWFLMVIASIGAIPAFFIVDGAGPTRSLESDDEDEDDTEDVDDEGGVVGKALDDDDCLSLHSEITYGAISSSTSPSRNQSGKVSKASSSTNLLG